MAKAKKTANLRIRQVRSPIGYPKKQGVILRSLGLRRMHHVIERKDNPAVRGMIAKIPHLVEVVEDAS